MSPPPPQRAGAAGSAAPPPPPPPPPSPPPRTGGGRPAPVPALPAQRRHLPGRAVQHRQLRAADAHAGAAMRPGRGRLHLDRRRLPHLRQPCRAGADAPGPRAACLSHAEPQAPAAVDLRLPVRRLRGAGLPASPGDQGAGGGVSATTAPLALIASVAHNGVIGQGNQLVWRESEDARWFRQQTLGCPVIMGRKTWDSLPARLGPRPGRENTVPPPPPLGRDAGARGAHTRARALARAPPRAAPRFFVIGGAQLFAQALPLAGQLV